MLKPLCVAIISIACSLSAFGQNYQSAESIEYDEANNRFLISNGSNMLARASDGTLSFFGTGNTSHGLEVMGNYIYGLDFDRVKAFDLDTESEVMNFQISGAQFLNGLTNDGNGILYATDFSANKIYKIDVTDLLNPSYEVIVDNTAASPNGILYDEDNNRLIFVNWGANAKIQAIDLVDYSVSDILTTSYSNIDGIDDDGQQNYFISVWSTNQIIQYDSNFENPIVVITPTLNSPADIGYAQAIDTLAIPEGNTAHYIGFEVALNLEDINTNEFNLLVYPNPGGSESWIQFELNQTMDINLQIVDIEGRVHYQMNEKQMAGIYKIPIRFLALSKGHYRIVLRSGNQIASTGFIIL